MKVLKSGSKNKTYGKKLTCKGSGLGKETGGCGALLLVTPADICDNFSTGGEAYWFYCPKCSVKTFVSYNTFFK